MFLRNGQKGCWELANGARIHLEPVQNIGTSKPGATCSVVLDIKHVLGPQAWSCVQGKVPPYKPKPLETL